MLKIRYVFILLGMLLCSSAAADVQVSIGIGLPHASIGINVPAYPRLVVVPGYPVYYAPRLQANYFFYDGMYWVYQDDGWYASSWYNGPWWFVEPEIVPVYVLRIPVRYYILPPRYFYGWRADAPPRWGDHWGHDWEQHRRGWNRWDRRAVPPPAPPPVYQRQYSGDRYPRHVEQQHKLQQQQYRYQPREPLVQQHYREQARQRAPDRQGNDLEQTRGASDGRDGRQQNSGPPDSRRSAPTQQEGAPASRSQPSQRGEDDGQRPGSGSPSQGRPEAHDGRLPPQPSPQGREHSQQGKDGRGEPTPEYDREQEPERGGWDRYRTQ